MGPVVGLEYNLCFAAVAGEGLHDVPGPGVSVPHLRASKCVEVVQGACAVFRHPEGIFLRKPGVHLRRGFCARGHLEFHLYPVDGAGVAGGFDTVVGGQVGNGAGGLSHSDADGHGACLTGVQYGSVLIACPPAHGCAGVYIFADRVFLESLRGYDGDIPLCHFFRGYDSLNAAVMVHVWMAHDDAHDRALP